MSPLLRLGLLGGGRALAAALGSLAAVVLARSLTAESLGLWSLALAVQGYALHLGELGLRSVATAEAGRGRAAWRPLLRRYLVLRLPISIVVVGAVAGLTAVLAPASLLLVLLATASILAAALQLDWLALAADRPGLAAALLLARPLAFLAALLLWPGALTPTLVAALFLAAWLLAGALSWVCLRLPAPATGPAPDARSLLAQGAPLCAVTLLNQAMLSADLLLAGFCLGAVAAGHYYIASQIATAGLVLANAAGQAALARLARHPPGSQDFARALGAEMRLVVGCGLLLSLILLTLGPVLTPLLFGREHAPAVPILLALLPWFLLQHPTTLLQSALAAAGRGRRVLGANLAMLAVLVPVMLLAATEGSLILLALARGVAELVRLSALLLALPAESRSSRLLLRSCRPGPTGRVSPHGSTG